MEVSIKITSEVYTVVAYCISRGDYSEQLAKQRSGRGWPCLHGLTAPAELSLLRRAFSRHPAAGSPSAVPGLAAGVTKFPHYPYWSIYPY